MEIIKREEAFKKAKEIGEKQFIEDVKYLNEQIVDSISKGLTYYSYFKNLKDYPRLRGALERAGYTLEFPESNCGYTRISW